MTLAIIGTAGRGDDYAKLSKDTWNNVKKTVLKFIEEHSVTDLISGGAAFADHLAVGLFNKEICSKLHLALPCQFDIQKNEFVSEGFKSAGGTANYYHKRFSKMMGRESLTEISAAIQKQCKLSYGKGFLDRNKIVAENSVILLAITFGEKEQVKDGGTSHTTRLFIKKNGNENAYHLDLNEMKIYSNATVN